MKVSLKWLREFVDLSDFGSPQEIADLLTSRGLEVEAVRAQAAGLEKVITVQILKRDKHPEADRLSVCLVSLGSGDPLEIVCGAQNMKTGDIVALAQVGAVLPGNFKIERSKIRGVVSNGMLCSEEELGFAESSEGIMILPAGTALGRPLAETLRLDDTIFELGITPNRGDCLSLYGIAREIAAARGLKLREPEVASFKIGGSAIGTELAAGRDGRQFWAALLEGVKIGPSSEDVVSKLEAVGARSVNNVVDATNLVLFELGQPVHAYDADRLKGLKLSITEATKGEKLPLLDGSTVELDGSELVISDGARAVALAGVMGGGNSEVQDGTQRLFLEVAEFAPSRVRRTAKKFGLSSESSYRFERGVDPEGQKRALGRLIYWVQKLSGGKLVAATSAVSEVERRMVSLASDFIPKFLGMEFRPGEVERVLVGLGFEIDARGPVWNVKVPTWRLDIERPEDLADEVARSVGFDRLPSTMPALNAAPAARSSIEGYSFQRSIELAKDAMVELGMNETVSFAFSSEEWLKRFGFEGSVRVQNPLSEEQRWMVPSLIPGLVQAVVHNWSHHFGSEPLPLRLFELRPTFKVRDASVGVKALSQSDSGVVETWKLAWVLSGPRIASGFRAEEAPVDFRDLQAMFEGLLARLGTRGVRFSALSKRPAGIDVARLLHPGMGVEVLAGKGAVGAFGLLHPRVSQGLKIRAPLWIGEIEWEPVAKLCRYVTEHSQFTPWSEFPPMERDFALLVKDGVDSDTIVQAAVKAAKPLARTVKVFDVYRGSQVAAGMTSVAVRVIFSDATRSLQEAEVEAASQKILSAWKEQLGAELRG